MYIMRLYLLLTRYSYLIMPFSTGTGLEHVGVVGLDQDCWRAELEDAGSSGLW